MTLIALLVLGCSKPDGDDSVKVRSVDVYLGESGEEFLKRNGLDEKSSVDRQPAGLNFYRVRWPTSDRGTVKVLHGEHSFTIADVLSVKGTEDAESMERGVFDYTVNFGMAGGGDVEHDAVRKEFTDFLKSIESAGWRRVISYTDPRLSGEAAYRYYFDDPAYSFPMDYELTFEEWMALDEEPLWMLYADEQFMMIRFHRDRKRTDPKKPGGYLFILQLMGVEEYAKSHFTGDDRERWRELWGETIAPLKRMRLEREQALEKSGVAIDKDYRDPIVHPDDPVEVDEPQ